MFVHEFNTFADHLLLGGHCLIVLGVQRSIHSTNQMTIFVEQILCVPGASYIAENKTTFMELVIYGEGDGDKRLHT